MNDMAREQLIKWHGQQLLRHLKDGGRVEALEHQAAMTQLIDGRSIEQVEKMEQTFFNGGTGAPGQRNPVHAGTPSPFNGLDGRTGNGW